jgi:hypothetical protein
MLQDLSLVTFNNLSNLLTAISNPFDLIRIPFRKNHGTITTLEYNSLAIRQSVSETLFSPTYQVPYLFVFLDTYFLWVLFRLVNLV